MKSILLIVQLAFGLALFLSAILPAYPRGSGLDSYGCHHNRKAGGDQCAGRSRVKSFASQDEMLKKQSPEKVERDKKIKVKS